MLTCEETHVCFRMSYTCWRMSIGTWRLVIVETYVCSVQNEDWIWQRQPFSFVFEKIYFLLNLGQIGFSSLFYSHHSDTPYSIFPLPVTLSYIITSSKFEDSHGSYSHVPTTTHAHTPPSLSFFPKKKVRVRSSVVKIQRRWDKRLKLERYNEDYLNVNSISFMSVVPTSTGRLHCELLRILF